MGSAVRTCLALDGRCFSSQVGKHGGRKQSGDPPPCPGSTQPYSCHRGTCPKTWETRSHKEEGLLGETRALMTSEAQGFQQPPEVGIGGCGCGPGANSA